MRNYGNERTPLPGSKVKLPIFENQQRDDQRRLPDLSQLQPPKEDFSQPIPLNDQDKPKPKEEDYDDEPILASPGDEEPPRVPREKPKAPPDALDIHENTAPIYVANLLQHGDPSGQHPDKTGAYFKFYYIYNLGVYGLKRPSLTFYYEAIVFVYKDVVTLGGFEWDLSINKKGKDVTPYELGIGRAPKGLEPITPDPSNPNNIPSWVPFSPSFKRIYYIPLSALVTTAYIIYYEYNYG
jgi:hypothetical protein